MTTCLNPATSAFITRITNLETDVTQLQTEVAQLESTINSVLLFGARTGTGFDNAPVFEAALAEGDIYIPAGTTFYSVTRAIRVPSNRTIRCDRNTWIRMADGAWGAGEAGLMENDDQTSGNVNISVYGGIWDGNKPNNTRSHIPFQPQTVFRFKSINGLFVRDITIKDPLMFSFLAGDIENCYISGVKFDQYERISNGDGVHLSGPLKNFTVRDIWGNTGDDLVSIVATDAANSEFLWTQGIVEDGLIENLDAPLGNSCFRLLSGDGFECRRVTARNLRGTFDGSGILIGPFTTPNSMFRDILIDGVQIIRSNATQSTQYPVIQIDGNTNNIQIRNVQRSINDNTNWPTLTLVTLLSYGDITFDGYQDNGPVDRDMINMRENVRSLVVSNVQMRHTNSLNGSAQVIRTIKTIGGVTADIVASGIRLEGVSCFTAADDGDDLLVHISDYVQRHGFFVCGAVGKLRMRLSNAVATDLFYAGVHYSAGGDCQAVLTNCEIDAEYGAGDFYNTDAIPQRLETYGCRISSTSGEIINLNTMDDGVIASVKSLDGPISNTTRTNLTPLVGDMVRDADGLTYIRQTSGWKLITVS